MATVLKSTEWALVSQFALLDKRKRITLGPVKVSTDAYSVYQNEAGQIVLDPVRVVPVTETRLWETPKASSSGKRGKIQGSDAASHDLGNVAAPTKEVQ